MGEFPNAWQLAGDYRVEGANVLLDARLFRGKQQRQHLKFTLPVADADQQVDILLQRLKATIGH